MLEHIKEKIIKGTKGASRFFKENLAQIVFLFFIFQLLVFARSLPYINIIEDYVYYSIAILLFFAMLLFRISIPTKKLIQITLALFVAALFTTILAFSPISDLLGFIIYVLLFYIVSREVIRNRKEFKEEKEL